MPTLFVMGLFWGWSRIYEKFQWVLEHFNGYEEIILENEKVSAKLKGRLKFSASGDGNRAPFPSALVVWNADESDIVAIHAAFSDAWHVPPSSNRSS
jgi:hypothetical protein